MRRYYIEPCFDYSILHNHDKIEPKLLELQMMGSTKPTQLLVLVELALLLYGMAQLLVMVLAVKRVDP